MYTQLESPVSMLDPEVHKRLIADLDNVSSVAGVQVRFLEDPMAKYCGAKEIDWVKNFNKYRSNGVPGLVLEGVPNPDSRCQAIGGALLRNFIDARVIPLGTLLDAQQNGTAPNPTVLLVPNLFIKMTDKGVPAWRMQNMYDLLLHRAVHNKPSVLYIQNKEDFGKVFGAACVDFLSNFKWVQG